MSIVDLKKRTTEDWSEKCNNIKSPDSFVYVKDRTMTDPYNSASMEIEVGESYILTGSSRLYKIPDEGLKIKPKQTVVIYSKQKLSLPLNVFGVVTGKGNYIYQGCLVSTGKIDPGFEGHLKIGFYNGGTDTVILKPGAGFASVFFINTEFTLPHALENYQTSTPADLKQLSVWRIILNYVREHIISFTAWVIVALPTAIYYTIEIIKMVK